VQTVQTIFLEQKKLALTNTFFCSAMEVKLLAVELLQKRESFTYLFPPPPSNNKKGGGGATP
jgi:hypothetical protein